jgi:electron transfer flavoprotein beta subunit
MKILVLLKMVPDIVEELEIGADGRSLDQDAVRPIVSERDDHALEQALLLKERSGATVTALALEAPEVDEVLFTALAKGADRAVKVTGLEAAPGSAAAAGVLAAVLPAVPDLMPVDLVLAGCQAIDDLDGVLAPALAERLAMPYLGIVTGVTVAGAGGPATVLKEFAGGTRGRYTVCLPAVLGIQAAEKPPRYVPVAKVRAAMKTRAIDEVPGAALKATGLVAVTAMTKPEAAGRAEMLEGSPEAVAAKLVEILAARGLA